MNAIRSRSRAVTRAITGVHRVLSALLIALALVVTAHAQSRLEQAEALLQGGQAEQAFPLFEDLALDGDVTGLLRSATLLQQGRGTPRDLALATEYLGRAAALGSAEGQRRYGQALLSGSGIEADPRAAREWLERAREQGDVEAGVDLGETLRRGLGVEADPGSGLDLLQRAADQGSVRAQELLADVYLSVRDGEADAATRDWVESAADEGDANAQAQLAYLFGSGAGGETPNPARARELYEQAALQGHADAQASLAYSFHTAAEDQRQLEDAVAWYQEAAENGQPEAQNNLGLAYMMGESVSRDPVRAARWFERAATQGNAEAENNLGLLLAKGDGLERDAKKARTLFESAASKGLPQALTNLGYLSLNDPISPNPAEAARWFEEAAAQGYAPAQGNLGYLYQTGRGVPRDYAKALALYHRAAGRDYVYAQRNLGQTYHYGLGTKIDLPEAVRWYAKAKERGDAVSARAIEEICSAALVPGCGGEVVVLLREEDGKIGKVLVQSDDGSEVLLDSDFSTSRIGTSGTAGAVAAGQTDVESIFAVVLAEMPPEPVKRTLYFVDGSAALSARSRPALAALVETVREELAVRETVEVDVVGHADRVGESADNDALSQQRAEWVRGELLGTGIAPERIKAFWRGERAPAVRTADGVSEARNRRVEVFVR